MKLTFMRTNSIELEDQLCKNDRELVRQRLVHDRISFNYIVGSAHGTGRRKDQVGIMECETLDLAVSQSM